MNKRTKKITYWTLSILLLSIIIGEVSLRIFYHNELSIKENADDIFADDSTLFYTYKPGITFQVNNKTIRVNKDGFLGDDIGPKSADTFRIAFVGACGVAGSVHQPEYYDYPSMLQQLFSDRNYNVQILNCGIDGDDRTLEHFLAIEYKVLNYDPDIVFLEYALPFYSHQGRRENCRSYKLTYPRKDIEGLHMLRGMVDTLHANYWWIKPLTCSYIARSFFYKYKNEHDNMLSYYIQLYKNKGISLGKWRPRQYTLEESAQMVDSLKQRLKKQDIQLFLLRYSSNPETYLFAKDNKLPLLSLNTDFEEDDYFYKDSHYNENGCKKIANRLYELIVKYNLVPEHYHNH